MFTGNLSHEDLKMKNSVVLIYVKFHIQASLHGDGDAGDKSVSMVMISVLLWSFNILKITRRDVTWLLKQMHNKTYNTYFSFAFEIHSLYIFMLPCPDHHESTKGILIFYIFSKKIQALLLLLH